MKIVFRANCVGSGSFLGVFAVAFDSMLFHGTRLTWSLSLRSLHLARSFCTAVCPQDVLFFRSCSPLPGGNGIWLVLQLIFNRDCFDSSLLNKQILFSSRQKAVVSCVKVGDWVTLPDVPFAETTRLRLVKCAIRTIR